MNPLNLFRRRSDAATVDRSAAGATVAGPADRDIFEFHDGRGPRREDPLLLWNALWSDEEVAFEEDLDKLPSYQSEVFNRIIGLTRRAFRIPPLADGGLTEMETLDVLNRFMRFADDLKKKQGPWPMPSRFLESELRARARNHSTTPPAADSFSTASGSPTDEPTPLSKPCQPSCQEA